MQMVYLCIKNIETNEEKEHEKYIICHTSL